MYLYLLEFDHGYKVGITKSLRTRLATYRSPWCYSINKAFVWSHPKARYVEDRIKLLYRDARNRFSSEFFFKDRLNDDIVLYITDVLRAEAEIYSGASLYNFKWKMTKSMTMKNRVASMLKLRTKKQTGPGNPNNGHVCSVHQLGAFNERINWVHARNAGLFCDKCVHELDRRRECSEKMRAVARTSRSNKQPNYTVQNAPRRIVEAALHKALMKKKHW